ncbi:MAG: helix-turn-helix domain-containing protein [Agathobaculum sp.]
MSFYHVLELCQNEQKGRDVFMFYDVYVELCHNNGKSPSAVAQELGINKSNVSNWKNNGYTPRGAVLNKIAEYFGVSVDYLLGKEQKEKPLVNDDEELTEYLEQLRTRPELKMMFQLTKDATKEDVEKAVKVIEAMLGKD